MTSGTSSFVRLVSPYVKCDGSPSPLVLLRGSNEIVYIKRTQESAVRLCACVPETQGQHLCPDTTASVLTCALAFALPVTPVFPLASYPSHGPLWAMASTKGR